MKNIYLQINTVKTAVQEDLSTDFTLTSLWLWIAVVECFIIVFLLLRLKSKKKNLAFEDLGKSSIKKAKEQNIDMDNLMNSINGSRALYKELSKKCHPDRFVNDDRQKLAEDIFQEISSNKRDFDKLSTLKKRAIEELNINF